METAEKAFNSWLYSSGALSGQHVMLIAFPAPVREELCSDGFRLKQLSRGGEERTSLNH